MMRRFLATLHARNMEFLRDRSSLGWNVIFPVVLVFALATIFSGDPRPMFKVGVVQAGAELDRAVHPLLETEYIDFFPVADADAAVSRVQRHRLDMLVQFGAQPRYWVSADSPKGYILERVVRSAPGPVLERAAVDGQPLRYIDWLLPGILGMNMMFSCLFGVGYVVVRYRKNGFLKRLSATPLRAIEFITAQVVSRLLLIMALTVAVYIGTDLFIGFRMDGSYLALIATAMLGAAAMVSMGFLVAARVSSEELAGGLLNMLSWPMMLVSGVWFSMEGTHPLLQHSAEIFPLTHLMVAARAVMLDGAGWTEIAPRLLVLAAMTLTFLLVGAVLFKWRRD